MHLENKFLFLGKIFVIIFILINGINLLPLRLNDIFFYSNFFNIILDTTTLLLLGLSIPRFLFLRKISILKKLNLNRVDEADDISFQINTLEKKQYSNYKITRYLSIVFLIIALVQPINLMFILNRSDIFIGNAINLKSKNLDLRKNQIMEMLEINSYNETEELKLEKKERNKKLIDNLERNHKADIDNLLKNNNSNKFREIKYIIRNIFISLVWAFAFFKLSKISLED